MAPASFLVRPTVVSGLGGLLGSRRTLGSAVPGGRQPSPAHRRPSASGTRRCLLRTPRPLCRGGAAGCASPGAAGGAQAAGTLLVPGLALGVSSARAPLGLLSCSIKEEQGRRSPFRAVVKAKRASVRRPQSKRRLRWLSSSHETDPFQLCNIEQMVSVSPNSSFVII